MSSARTLLAALLASALTTALGFSGLAQVSAYLTNRILLQRPSAITTTRRTLTTQLHSIRNPSYMGATSYDDADDAALELKMAREQYDDLRGTSPKLTVQAFKQWEDIADMVSFDVLDDALLDQLISNVVSDTNADMDFEQFRALVDIVNDMYILLEQQVNEDDIDEDFEDDFGEGYKPPDFLKDMVGDAQ